MTAANASDWYVKATATAGGDGSESKPFNTLADVEAASAAGDTIFVLHTPADKDPLNGGITLKDGQRLIGTGPRPTVASADSARARMTNTTLALDGSIVHLALGNEISGIHFEANGLGRPILGLGIDFSSTNIHDNLFTGGALAFWPIIDLFSFAGDITNVSITNNVFRDAPFHAGIRAVHFGTSTGAYHLEGNTFEGLGFWPQFFFAMESSEIDVTILDSSADNIGVGGNNADSILLQAFDSARLNGLVRGYTYDNTDQLGNRSNTGLEVFMRGDSNSVSLTIEDSTFSNAVTEAIQLNNLSANGRMEVEIKNTKIIDANPQQYAAFTGGAFRGGAIAVIPECLPAGSPTCLGLGGAGNVVTLLVQDSDIIGSSGYAVSVLDLGTGSSTVDLGGGSLGSFGQNRILDNAVGEIEFLNVVGDGKFNWWGGGAPRVDLFGASSFLYAPTLVDDPRP